MEANLVGDGVAKTRSEVPLLELGAVGGDPRRPGGARGRPLPRRPGADRRHPGRQDRSALPAQLSNRRRASTRATRRRSPSTPRGNRLFADHEDEVRVFGALGEEIPKAADHRARRLARAGVRSAQRERWSSPKRAGEDHLLAMAVAGPAHLRLRRTRPRGRALRSPTSNPNGSPSAPRPAASSTFDRHRRRRRGGACRSPGETARRADRSSSTPAGSFDFGSNDNDIAVDTAPDRAGATSSSSPARATAPSGRSPRPGRFLWELKPESGDEFARAHGRRKGRPLDRRTERRRLRIRGPATAGPAARADRSQDRRRRRSLGAIAFAGPATSSSPANSTAR